MFGGKAVLWGRTVKVGLLAVLPLAAALQPPQAAPPQEPAVFHSGTRLVEVEVVVRSKRERAPGVGSWLAWTFDSGPPYGPPGPPVKGLTRDDFTLFDDGKPQPLAVFSAGQANGGKVTVLPLPEGAVSNRTDSRGESVNGSTAVLLDLLNLGFDLTDYARLGLKNLLRKLNETDNRIALYSLGENLHILHDFNDDPQKLKDIANSLNQPHGKLPAELAKALGDFGDLMDIGREQTHAQMTRKALQIIMQRLARMPGRKNLVWLIPPGAPGLASIISAAQQANIVVYPVIVRSVPTADDIASFDQLIQQQHSAAGLAARTGGRVFFDAMDLTFAVEAAEEESSRAYVLGFYPPEETLDGKFHSITVKLREKVLEVRYRPGYLATKAPTSGQAVERIGLTGQLVPDPTRPNLRRMRLTVDLHDIHLEPKEGSFTGAFDFSLLIPGFREARSATAQVSIPADRLGPVLETGYIVNIDGIDPWPGDIRVSVRDQSTGAAGDLRVPVPKE